MRKNILPLEQTLSPAYYLDPAIFEQEKERIFFQSWLYVGHQSQVINEGDYFTRTLLDQSLIIMRGRDGKLRGFYNVCPHRAHELLLEECGNKKVITCPYHAWVFETDGQLRAARGTEQMLGFDPHAICISQFKVEVFCGFIFVNLDPRAASMTEIYPQVETKIRQLVPDIEQKIYTHHHTKQLQANWKVAVENYNECYHCPSVHPTFSSSLVAPKSYRITPGTRSLFHTAQAQAKSKQAYAIDESKENATQYGGFYLWPTFSLQVFPGNVVNSYHWFPLDVEHTIVYRTWYFDSQEPTPEQWDLIALDRTTTFAEDLALVNAVQRGLKSRGYQPGPLVLDPSGVATITSENTTFELKKLVLKALA